jgi:Family of unknown function (DUF5684)
MTALLLASSGAGVGIGIGVVIYVAVVVVWIAALWQVFTKADEKGWKAIIPIWNTLIVLKISGRPWWWIFLFLIPSVDIVVYVIVYYNLAKSLAKGAAFAVGLIILPFIFIPILGFGSAIYAGPWASGPRAVEVY